MAGEIFTAAGASVAIGTTAAIPMTSTSAALTAFAADTYTEIELVEDVGEWGDESTEVTFTAVKDSRVRKAKGSRNAGTITLVVGRDASDPGQDALRAAELSPLSFNLRITLDDAPTADGDPTIYYMRVKIMSQRTQVGTVDNVIRTTFMLSIDSAIYEISASA